MTTRFDASAYPLAAQAPHWLTDMPFWQRHIPFAFALMEMSRPRVFVELGTHGGDSYCAFCQAVDTLHLDTICYAVDTWEGDRHTGHYEMSVFERLRAYHDPRYGRFSTLVRKQFDDAVSLFADGAIDLLHIDGTHTYEAVRHDFETWLPKMSEHGIIVLHDTHEYRDDFGVWNLWEQLCARYPHFAFPFGHGLGVVAVGQTIPVSMQSFFLDAHHTAETVRHFYNLSERIVAMRSSAATQAEVPDEREWTRSLIQSLDDNGKPASPRLIAFYLPQFHPIPENDSWWGKGFTEWTNVVQGRPLFPGHNQPHLPADLGFYDLRLPEVREAQAYLARRNGIHGFCYYHYWFKGRRLLERPFDEVVASGQPDFPFCLCWVNESWTRNWDGREQECLVEQQYSDQDDVDHIHWLIKVFRDERYIRINGRPLLLVYRPQALPNAAGTFAFWREECRRAGMEEPYLVMVETHGSDDVYPEDIVCDASAEFIPHDAVRLAERVPDPDGLYGTNIVMEYREIATKYLGRDTPKHLRFPCLVPSWDNSVRHRSGDAVIIKGSTPELYERWLRATIAKSYANAPEERIIFINAWNEWAEGAHLEPDLKSGHLYLDATRRSLGITDPATDTNAIAPVIPRVPALEERYQRLSEKYLQLQERLTEQLTVSERTPLVQELQRDLRNRQGALDAALAGQVWLSGERERLEEAVAAQGDQVRCLNLALQERTRMIESRDAVIVSLETRLTHLENELIPWKNEYIGELEKRVRNLEGSKVLRVIHRLQRRSKTRKGGD